MCGPLYVQSTYLKLLNFRWPATCIHGDKSQPERDFVLQGTVSYRIKILFIKLFLFDVQGIKMFENIKIEKSKRKNSNLISQG